MADNTTLNVGTAGDVMRDVQKGGSSGPKTQVFILDVGGGGTEALCSATNPLPVGGNIASGAADAGNPVKAGGVYHASPITLADAQRGDLQLDVNGYVNVHVAAGSLPSTGNVASGAADSGNPVKVGGVFNSSPITLTTGQRGDLQLDANGYLNVHVAAGSSGNAAAAATGSAVPASADFTGLNVAGNLRGQTGVNPSGTVYAAQVDVASLAGTTASVGNGVSGAGCLRVNIASDNTAFAVVAGGNVASGAADAGNPVKVGGVYHAAPITLTDGQRGDAQIDANGYLLVHVAAGSSGNAAASATGSAVPASADFAGLNVAGTLRGRTGVNPTGTVYAAQTDLSSVGGAVIALGATTAAASLPVTLPANVTGTGTITAADIVTATTTGVNSQPIYTGVPTAGSAVVLDVTGDASFGIQLSGTFVGTLSFERSIDGGTTWCPAGVLSPGTVFSVASIVVPSNLGQIGIYHGYAGGSNKVRVRCTAFTSGSATVTLLGAQAINLVTVANAIRVYDNASGQSVTVKPASTAPIATDPALVVSLSPNSPGVALVGAATGGDTPYSLVCAATTNATSVKASAGQLKSYELFNNNATLPRYVKFYDKASAPTVGTDTPVLRIMIPPLGGANVALPVGAQFSTGIAFAVTNGIADSDTTAINASECLVNLTYK